MRYLIPLAEFLEDLEKERYQSLATEPIYEDYDSWYSNTGDPLDEESCLKLAQIVRGAIEHGQVERWAQKNGRRSHLTAAGHDIYQIDHQLGPLTREYVADFAGFPEKCGGFTVS